MSSNLIREMLESLKVDGVRNVLKTQFVLMRFLWIVVIAGFSLLAALFIRTSVREYLEYRVTSEARFLPDKNVPFPVVTICNMNPFMSTPYALSLIKLANITSFSASTIFTLELYMKNTTGAYLNTTQKMLMDNLNLMLLSCTFQGAACDLNDFVFVDRFAFSYQCYRFNTGYTMYGNQTSVKSVSSISTDHSFNTLSMELYAGLSLSTMPTRGYNVYVQYRDDFAYNSDRYYKQVVPGAGSKQGLGLLEQEFIA
jgi:hypothetical protein